MKKTEIKLIDKLNKLIDIITIMKHLRLKPWTQTSLDNAFNVTPIKQYFGLLPFVCLGV